MPISLVHLSDIHFHGYGDGWDEDADQRAELIRDLEQIRADRNVEGIIVGGDIAYRGTREEYDIAREWLEDVCKSCGVDISRVWVVPGNHDVDWSVVRDRSVATDFRNALRECDLYGLDNELKQRLSVDPGGEAVVMPLSNYNEFAAGFSCAVTAEQPHWADRSLSCDGLPIRLTGLNSVLASDSSDSRDDEQHKLVLGTWQCKLPREGDPIHIVVSHHPPDWIRDWDLVEPYLRRAHLLLFGHEHRYESEQMYENGTVCVYAGAVGPHRFAEPPDHRYSPSWAFITLACKDTEIRVQIEPRVWSHETTRFVAHPDGYREFLVLADLPLEEGSPLDWDLSDEEIGSEAMAASPLVPEQDHRRGDELPANESDLRSLGVRFMTLAPTHRLEIARRLGVLDEPEDLDLPKAKRDEQILSRIRERGMVDDLRRELEHG